MKTKRYFSLLLAILLISGCNSESDTIPTVAADKKDDTKVPLITENTETSDITVTAETPITFDSRNTLANEGLSEETAHRMQYQTGHINFIPVKFNNVMLTESTFSEFESLLRSSASIVADNEWVKDGETTVTNFIMENGDNFTFYDYRPIELMVDSTAIFPIDYQMLGLTFGDTVEDVNRQLGTEFVEYPELTTLVIRDTDSDGYIQFTFDENNRISRMEYRFTEFTA
ncbi:MAG: hypothetical protein IK990_15060 [Ruminiclostridium sp.]|nr:hypothetical protein [Ruminiclostridium sp.]MBP3856922.1 hypothetical protein [Ruminiclostridium sp.]